MPILALSSEVVDIFVISHLKITLSDLSGCFGKHYKFQLTKSVSSLMARRLDGISGTSDVMRLRSTVCPQ